MKTIDMVVEDIVNHVELYSSIEKTKITVWVDRIIEMPTSDNVLSLTCYALVYRAHFKDIVIYHKENYSPIDIWDEGCKNLDNLENVYTIDLKTSKEIIKKNLKIFSRRVRLLCIGIMS